jgi:uncharacterized protein (DUF1015 family)
MRIRPFAALRPSPDAVGRIVSPPYDVVTTEEARRLAAANPLSMLHIVRPEIDFPDGTDPHSDPVYAKASENFRALREAGHLIRESGPCLYVYQQQMGDHTQQGLVALCHVGDYEADRIKKHEKTRVDKENDRTRLTSDLGANTGPVFLTYRDNEAISSMMREASKGEPLYDLVADDGIRHTVWRIEGGNEFTDAFASVPCAYVADGHHRAASAARVARERRAAHPEADAETADFSWFLTVLFPGAQLRILPYNRLVHDLGGRDADAFLAELKKTGPVRDADSPDPDGPGDIRFHLGGKWRSLALEPAPGADPVASLDVSMLQDRVLAPLLGIADPRTSERIEFVGGIRGTEFLEDAVAGGRAAVAFSMFPVGIGQLMAISDAGLLMPPKSTWFEPKLRSGFFLHTF